jgi:hypothetical protein
VSDDDQLSALQVERLAANEATARAENYDRAAWLGGHNRVWFICECPDPACEQSIPLTGEDWRVVRKDTRQFAVAPGHADERLGVVVERTENYWIVGKRGAAGDVADATAQPAR